MFTMWQLETPLLALVSLTLAVEWLAERKRRREAENTLAEYREALRRLPGPPPSDGGPVGLAAILAALVGALTLVRQREVVALAGALAASGVAVSSVVLLPHRAESPTVALPAVQAPAATIDYPPLRAEPLRRQGGGLDKKVTTTAPAPAGQLISTSAAPAPAIIGTLRIEIEGSRAGQRLLPGVDITVKTPMLSPVNVLRDPVDRLTASIPDPPLLAALGGGS
jgi:hypothetical protein